MIPNGIILNTPTSPVLFNYKLSKEGLRIEWIPSSSSDIAGYEINIEKNNGLIKRVFFEK